MKNLTKLQQQKNQKKLSCLTVYDALVAQVIEASSVDIALVGDSLGMVIQGGQNTLAVSMADMVYHSSIVAQQLKETYLIVDMPYQSYQTPQQALKNARTLIAVGADMVKLEGGYEQSAIIKALRKEGIDICGHLGLQPQSIKTIGAYKMQGKTKAQAAQILSDAKHLEQLGIGFLVLEYIPSTLAQEITQRLSIPTIGIGAGYYCDAQVLVFSDIIGLGKAPKFAKNFLAENESIAKAVEAFSQAVKSGEFPEKNKLL